MDTLSSKYYVLQLLCDVPMNKETRMRKMHKLEELPLNRQLKILFKIRRNTIVTSQLYILGDMSVSQYDRIDTINRRLTKMSLCTPEILKIYNVPTE